MLSSWKSDNDSILNTSNSEAKTVGTANAAPSHPKSSIAGRPQSANQSIVDESLTMRGDLESEAGILVKGKVIGNISCKTLIIDRGARVDGCVDATEVIVRGKIKGTITADRVHLEDSADVECDIYQNTFLAEEGARILGALKSKKDKKNGGGGMKVSVQKDKGSSGASVMK